MPTDTQKTKMTEQFKEELDFDVAVEDKCQMTSGGALSIMEALEGVDSKSSVWLGNNGKSISRL